MLAHFFEVCVTHIVDTEDEDVCVGICCAANGGEEGGGLFLGGLLLHGRGVDDAGALGFGHLVDAFL